MRPLSWRCSASTSLRRPGAIGPVPAWPGGGRAWPRAR